MPNHYAVEIPQNATRLTINVDRLTRSGRYDVHLRTGEPLRYRGRLIGSEANFENVGEVIVDGFSEFELPRCQTLYVGLIASDLLMSGESLYDISFETRDRR